MKAEEILEISKCGDLFPYGISGVKAKYRELAKEWHPDVNRSPDASKVFAKVNELYDKALKLLKDGIWEKTNYILISGESGEQRANGGIN